MNPSVHSNNQDEEIDINLKEFDEQVEKLLNFDRIEELKRYGNKIIELEYIDHIGEKINISKPKFFRQRLEQRHGYQVKVPIARV